MSAIDYGAQVVDFVARFLPDMKNNVYRVQVAFTKYSPNPKVRSDATTAILKGIVGVQVVASGIVADKAGKERELQDAYKALVADGGGDPKASKVPVPIPSPVPANVRKLGRLQTGWRAVGAEWNPSAEVAPHTSSRSAHSADQFDRPHDTF